MHRSLLKHTTAIRQRYVAGDFSGGDVVSFVSYDLIAQHMIGEDVKWATATGLVEP